MYKCDTLRDLVPFVQFKKCEKHPCLRPATLSKKRLKHRCFPVNFAKFLRTPFFNRILRVVASEW